MLFSTKNTNHRKGLQPIAVDIPQKLGEDYKLKYLCSVKSITVALLQSCFSLATDCQKQHDSARKRITEVKSEERKIHLTLFADNSSAKTKKLKNSQTQKLNFRENLKTYKLTNTKTKKIYGKNWF